jgi:hypothetical protein
MTGGVLRYADSADTGGGGPSDAGAGTALVTGSVTRLMPAADR